VLLVTFLLFLVSWTNTVVLRIFLLHDLFASFLFDTRWWPHIECCFVFVHVIQIVFLAYNCISLQYHADCCLLTCCTGWSLFCFSFVTGNGRWTFVFSPSCTWDMAIFIFLFDGDHTYLDAAHYQLISFRLAACCARKSSAAFARWQPQLLIHTLYRLVMFFVLLFAAHAAYRIHWWFSYYYFAYA